MPDLRSTRPRLPLLAVGAVAILFLAACGDEAPPPTPTEEVVATEVTEVEETVVADEATAEASPEVSVEIIIDDDGTPEGAIATPIGAGATPVDAGATPVGAGATPVVAEATPALPEATPI